MAKRDETNTKENIEQESEKVTSKQETETFYSKDELIAAAEAVFSVKPEVVAAALRMASKTEATKQEAEELIKAFMEKEVK